MCGTHRTTVSPSRSSTSRSTPCVDGCCGPMFRVSVSVAPIGYRPSFGAGGSSAARNEMLLNNFLHVVVQDHRPLPHDGVVLAERVTIPIVRQLDAAEVGMTLEDDAEEIVDLALRP